jgi:hypothetical protein
VLIHDTQIPAWLGHGISQYRLLARLQQQGAYLLALVQLINHQVLEILALGRVHCALQGIPIECKQAVFRDRRVGIVDRLE